MLETTEIRWFLPGASPLDARKWFRHLPWTSTVEPVRTDVYLRSPDMPGLGMKWRQGILQCKQEIGERRLQKCGGGSTGYIDSWRRWSFEAVDPMDGANSPDMLFKERQHWVPVRKRRRQCFVRWPQMIESTQPAWESGVVNGAIELASVNVLNETWWTLGLEASGDPKKRELALSEMARLILEQKGAPTLTAKDSMSYPRWLNTLIHVTGA